MIKKNKSSAYLILLLVIIVGATLVSHFVPHTVNETVGQQTTDVAQLNQYSPPEEWDTYTNFRFEYSINYPSDWNEGEEAGNGDGKSLHKDDNNEIIVYGTLQPSTFSTQNTPAEREVFTLNDGRKATELKLKDEEDKIRYMVFFEDNDTQYVFFAKTTENFFKENKKLLQEVAKGFKLSDGSECSNYAEITKFEQPESIVWDAKFDGCLVSCWGAAFTRVPANPKYPRFSAYVPDEGEKIDDKFLQENQTLRISGKFTGVDSDHVSTVFDGKCVPTVEIEKIERENRLWIIQSQTIYGVGLV